MRIHILVHPFCQGCCCGGRRNRSAAGRGRRCQSLIEKLRREQAAALRSQQYPTESCPVCLEDFQQPQQDSRPSAPPLSPDMVRNRLHSTIVASQTEYGFGPVS